MEVFHFLNEHFALKDMRERRLKISSYLDLNDPFEFASWQFPDRETRRIMREFLKATAESQGLICFSGSWRSPVQWAHYADNHRGLCLGFEIPDKNLDQVRYITSRPPMPANPKGMTREEKRDFLAKLAHTKFAHWSYEDEYRIYCTRKHPVDGLCYLPFSEELKLKTVIAGYRCALSRADIEEALKTVPGEIDIFKARPAFHSFRMVRQKSLSLWP